MRAAVLYAPGPPDAFVIEDIATPSPGPGEVLVRVQACGVSYRDGVERKGVYRRDVTFPLVIGLEISGEVAAVGPGVPLVGVLVHGGAVALGEATRGSLDALLDAWVAEVGEEKEEVDLPVEVDVEVEEMVEQVDVAEKIEVVEAVGEEDRADAAADAAADADQADK
jgi:hypothetical protein